MVNGNELLEKKGLREKVINRTDVLDKVKELILLPNTEYATTEQVAEYYEVGKEAITSLVHDNREEVESDGYKVIRRGDINESFEIPLKKMRPREVKQS